MPKSPRFKEANQVGRVQLPATPRLSTLSDERQHALTGPLNPLHEQARQQLVLSFITNNINKLDDDAPLLTRIGAYVVMFSQIESRVRAMYRQRYAMMHGLPAPQTSADDDDSSTADAALIPRVETTDLQRAVLTLYRYDDIDADTTKELLQCIAIRNKMVHQALYRLPAFQTDILPALFNLYQHMVRVRARLTTRLKNERDLYTDATAVQAVVRQQLADIPVGHVIPRHQLFMRLAGSQVLHVPVVAGQPLYLVARPSSATALVDVQISEEVGMHDLWHAIVQSRQNYVVFQKQTGTHQMAVRRLGEGLIVDAQTDQSGRYTTLRVQMQP